MGNPQPRLLMEFQAFEIGVVGLGDFLGLVIWPRLGCVHTVWPWEISLVSHLSLTWFVGNKDLGYSYFYIALPVTVCLWCTVWMPLGAVDLHIMICWLVGLNSVAGWLRLGIDSCCWPILTNQFSCLKPQHHGPSCYCVVLGVMTVWFPCRLLTLSVLSCVSFLFRWSCGVTWGLRVSWARVYVSVHMCFYFTFVP